MRALLATAALCAVAIAPAAVASCHEHGQIRTATGERYHPTALLRRIARCRSARTFASRIITPINDRGPSRGASRAIGNSLPRHH
jgi:hypothetical protein